MISRGGLIDYFDHFVVINPNFDILQSLNVFYIFSCVISSLFISLIWSFTLYFLIGFIIKYSAKKIQKPVCEKY